MNANKIIIKVIEGDSIMDIVSKILSVKWDEINLDFPFWHPVLHNYLSLKILKNKTEWKRVIIITNDIASKQVWKPLWFEYIIKAHKKISENPRELKERLWNREYLKLLIKDKKEKIIEFIDEKTINNSKYSSKNKIRKRWIIIILSWILFSLWLLFFIFNFAISRTYVYITPEIKIQNKARNIIFKEMWELEFSTKANTIKLEEYETEIEISEVFKSSQIDYESSSVAKWRIKVINETFEAKKFVPGTRFKTEDWVIFVTKSWENIAPATLDKDWNKVLWETFVYVEARYFDEEWKFIWERGNIKIDWNPKYLTIPWLKNDRDKIYWSLEKSTFWWSDKYQMMIWEKDIENAKNTVISNLKKDWIKKVNQELEVKNSENNKNYEIFKISDILEYWEPIIVNVDDVKVWDKVSEFTMKWKIKIKTLIYDKDELLKYLENKTLSSLLEWIEKIDFINKNSLNFINVVSRNDEEWEYKVTTEVQIWTIYNFSNKENSKVKEIKYSIAWLENEKAIELIMKRANINNVELENSPFYSSTVAKNPENIIIEIKK